MHRRRQIWLYLRSLKETFTQNNHDTEAFTRVVDSIVTNRFWGFPIFFIFLYIMFEGTFVLGEYPQQAIEWLVGLIAQERRPS